MFGLLFAPDPRAWRFGLVHARDEGGGPVGVFWCWGPTVICLDNV